MPDAGRDRAGSNTSNGETKSNMDFGACWGGDCTGGDCTGGVGCVGCANEDDVRRSLPGAGAGCVMTGSPRGATLVGGLDVSCDAAGITHDFSTLRSDARRWFSSVEGVGPPLMGRLAPSGVDPPRTPSSLAWCVGPEPASVAGGAAGGDWTLLGGGMPPEMDLNKSSMDTAWIEGGGETALLTGVCTGGPLAAFLSMASRGLFSILIESGSQLGVH